MSLRTAAGSLSVAMTDASSAFLSIVRPSRCSILAILVSLMSTRASRGARAMPFSTLSTYARTLATLNVTYSGTFTGAPAAVVPAL